MRTIKEIKKDLLTEYLNADSNSSENWDEFEELMEELIETVATLQREKCAGEAKLLVKYQLNSKSQIQTHYEDEVTTLMNKITVAKESILNAKL